MKTLNERLKPTTSSYWVAVSHPSARGVRRNLGNAGVSEFASMFRVSAVPHVVHQHKELLPTLRQIKLRVWGIGFFGFRV